MAPQAPAGWYPDPHGHQELRYWDGSQWTQYVGSRGPGGAVVPVADAPASAPSPTAGWYADPYGQYELRYWDGSQWTEHVSASGHSGTPPAAGNAVTTAEAVEAASALGRPSKKVARQVRNAGVAPGGAGGGTLFTEQVLVMNQRAKLIGSTLGYAIYNQDGRQLGTIQEIGRTIGAKLGDNLRNRTEANRAYRFQVVDMSGRVMLAITRPESGWFTKPKLVVEGANGTSIGQIALESFGVAGGIATVAHAGVTSASAIAAAGLGGLKGVAAGTVLGSVQGKLDSAVKGLDKVGHARFGLEADGQQLGSVHAESIEKWNFNVQDPTGTEVARITKTWAGWSKERFTKTDNYVIQMHKPLLEPLRTLVVAAALAIDVELKQRGSQTSGSSLWGTRRYK